MKRFVLFTCEHASHAIPVKYKHLFTNKEKILLTHRGFDHGTKELGKALGKSFNAPVVYGKFSRLLVDLNRSKSHKTAFSEMTKVLSRSQRREVLAEFHYPHWNEITMLIDQKIKAGFQVIHIGIHSFTPELDGVVRNAEIGILYDSRRKKEAAQSIKWQNAFRDLCNLRVRRNYPYDGKMDGLSSGMRKLYSEKQYLGCEIEVNHAILKTPAEIKAMEKLLVSTLKSVLSF